MASRQARHRSTRPRPTLVVSTSGQPIQRTRGRAGAIASGAHLTRRPNPQRPLNDPLSR